jgi:hypothetical protein
MAVLSKSWRDVALRGRHKEREAKLEGIGVGFHPGPRIFVRFSAEEGAVTEHFEVTLMLDEMREIVSRYQDYCEKYPELLKR